MALSKLLSYIYKRNVLNLNYYQIHQIWLLFAFSLRDIWLCQICAETREMWKKTGAWFYKSLPSYDRPQNASTFRSTSLTASTRRPEKPRNRGIKVNDSSSSDDSSEDITNDSDTITNARSCSISAKRSSSYFLERMSNLRSRPSNSTSSLNDDGFFYRKLSTLNLFGRSPSTSKCDTESNVFFADFGSSSANESPYIGSNIRRDSEPSTCSISETSSINDANAAITAINSTPHQMCREQPLGWLEVSLTYSEIEHTLDCFLFRARDLSAVDITSPLDPYARLNIVTQYDNLKQMKWLQTRTIHKTRCPEFNETVRFFGVEQDELATSILYVVILDEDKYGSDFLGTAKIQLGPVSQ